MFWHRLITYVDTKLVKFSLITLVKVFTSFHKISDTFSYTRLYQCHDFIIVYEFCRDKKKRKKMWKWTDKHNSCHFYCCQVSQILLADCQVRIRSGDQNDMKCFIVAIKNEICSHLSQLMWTYFNYWDCNKVPLKLKGFRRPYMHRKTDRTLEFHMQNGPVLYLHWV